MIRVTIFTVAIISLFAFNVVRCENVLTAQVQVVQNFTDYLKANPNVKLLQRLSRDEFERGQIRYRLGNRITGDRLVATNSASQQWATIQDVKLTLQYPRAGVGSVISYVEVLADQSSNLGQGYVTAGGVGQRQITLVIEAYQTLYFRYNSQIYGY